MTCSLLIARTFEQADHAAVLTWHWERHSEAFGRFEYRRPDRPREAIRWLPDQPHSLSGLRWATPVYLVDGWRQRRDGPLIVRLIDTEFFKVEDPELITPRRKSPREVELAEVRKTLARLEQRK